MALTFYILDKDTLQITADKNVVINITLESGSVDYIHADDFEFESNQDTLYWIFFRIKNEFYSINEIVNQAEFAYPSLLAEHKQEEADEQAMHDELSSPQATGRI